jgi:Tfp pilus assembly protein FimT
MSRKRYSLCIVDFLVGVAVLMILAALVVPHFLPPSNGAKAAELTHKTAPAQPGR